jgi:hypothetical protein
MILGFSTQLNGKPTYFVEKIHSGLLQNDLLQGFDLGDNHEFDLDKLCSCKPKLHTLRDDPKDCWHAGIMIDFFINVRTKKMFRFAPVLPVVSTQKIFITYTKAKKAIVHIDDKCFYMQSFPVEDNHTKKPLQIERFFLCLKTGVAR